MSWEPTTAKIPIYRDGGDTKEGKELYYGHDQDTTSRWVVIYNSAFVVGGLVRAHLVTENKIRLRIYALEQNGKWSSDPVLTATRTSGWNEGRTGLWGININEVDYTRTLRSNYTNHPKTIVWLVRLERLSGGSLNRVRYTINLEPRYGFAKIAPKLSEVTVGAITTGDHVQHLREPLGTVDYLGKLDEMPEAPSVCQLTFFPEPKARPSGVGRGRRRPHPSPLDKEAFEGYKITAGRAHDA